MSERKSHHKYKLLKLAGVAGAAAVSVYLISKPESSFRKVKRRLVKERLY